MYKCKDCGKEGTKEQLRSHVCNGIQRTFDDEDYFLETIILLSIMESNSPSPSPLNNEPSAPLEPSFEAGGGDFGGGGASDSYDSDSPGDSDTSSDGDSSGGDSSGD